MPTHPRVWYNQPKKPKPATSSITQSSFASQAKDTAEQEVSKATTRYTQDATMQFAKAQARHTNDEYYAGETQPWAQIAAKNNPNAWLPESTVSDSEIRATIGLPTNLSLDLFRADPSLWDKFPAAKERFARLQAEQEMGKDKASEENKGWASRVRGWLVDELKDTGIFVGEAYDALITKPLAMANEVLGEVFSEDATGARKMFGHALITGNMPGIIPGEGGAPRLATPQQILGNVTDALAEVDVGTKEQRVRYKERIIELKAEGVLDDEARAQAFNERTDITVALLYKSLCNINKVAKAILFMLFFTLLVPMAS